MEINGIVPFTVVVGVRVGFVGFIRQDDFAGAFAAADVFVAAVTSAVAVAGGRSDLEEVSNVSLILAVVVGVHFSLLLKWKSKRFSCVPLKRTSSPGGPNCGSIPHWRIF